MFDSTENIVMPIVEINDLENSFVEDGFIEIENYNSFKNEESKLSTEKSSIQNIMAAVEIINNNIDILSKFF